MDIYIDETNLESFLSQKEHALFPDVLKLLKQQLNINFNFSKNRLKENENLSAIIPTLTSGVADTETTFDNAFPNRPLKTNSAIHFNSEQLSSIYWIDDADGYKLLGAGAVLIALLGEEINETQKIFLNQEDYIFDKKWRINDDGFKSWDEIKEYSLPLTDIIIVDRYVISDKTIIEVNLHSLISALLHPCQSKVNLVIIVHPDNIGDDENEIIKNIKKCINDQTTKASKVTLIKTRKEHDRTIITNYNRIYSGDSFNFWDNGGNKITNGKEIIYSSNGKFENHQLVKAMIKDLQDIIDKNPDNIIGDKVSGFLNFESVH